jgi:hypothetical protein
MYTHTGGPMARSGVGIARHIQLIHQTKTLIKLNCNPRKSYIQTSQSYGMYALKRQNLKLAQKSEAMLPM